MATLDNKEFLQRLLETFRIEAREHVTGVSRGLAALRDAGMDAAGQLTELVFREAHSLKAAARAVNRMDIERICQQLEHALAGLKSSTVKRTPALLSALDAVNDQIADLLDDTTSVSIPGDRQSISRGADAALQTLAQALEAASRHLDPATTVDDARTRGPQVEPLPPLTEHADAPATSSRNDPTTSETVRLPVRRLDALMLRAEELLGVKLAAQEQVVALEGPLAALGEWRSECNRIRRLSARNRAGDEAGPMAQFLDWSESRLGALESSMGAMVKAADLRARTSATCIDQVQQDLQQILMLEARTVLDGFHKAVRDLARDQRKDVEFVALGGQVEIDRRILEGMREPLLHLVRNAVDHGIESAEVRARVGKFGRARIQLVLSPIDGDKAEFLLSDDGAGVPLKSLAMAAVKAGILSEAAAANAGPDELLPLMFHSGVSTSSMITEISGRGLGLAIVCERVERMGGTISVDSEPGQGTRFRIVIPTTLTKFRGIRVSAASQTFVIPTLGVESVVAVSEAASSTIENKPMLTINGAHVPLVKLAQVLGLVGVEQTAAASRVALVLGSGTRRVAFEVDEVFGDQEVLLKSLGRNLERVRNVSGATVLGDGRIAAILNLHDLIKSARLTTTVQSAPVGATPQMKRQRPVRVLLAEDSITARGLLKNILEVAGYEVKATVDGADAWAALKLEAFDAVVSDVEMPRMNGFDLTARIRADARLSTLPVMLITALESREDRERGAEAGANAYMLKGDFDQRRLLEVLRRLV